MGSGQGYCHWGQQ